MGTPFRSSEPGPVRASPARSVRDSVVQAARALGAELERRADQGPIDAEIEELRAVDELDRVFREAAAEATGTGSDRSGLVSASLGALDGSLELSLDPDFLASSDPRRLSVALSEALTSAAGAYQRAVLEQVRDARPEGLLGMLADATLGGLAARPTSTEAASEREPESAWGSSRLLRPEGSAELEVRRVGRPDALGGAVPW